MNHECPRCGALEPSIFFWSGMCANCFLSPETWIEPATVVAGAEVGPDDCVLCGVEIAFGELCDKCAGISKWRLV